MTDKLNQDGSINENWLAEEITSREAGLKEIDIAEVKEVLRVTLDILAELRDEFAEDKGVNTFDELIEKHKK